MHRSLFALRKHPSGKLVKYKEGMPSPLVLDDIAGVSLAKNQSLSVSPRYLEYSTAMGKVVFHHSLYCNRARRPHRPVVVRKAFSKGVVARAAALREKEAGLVDGSRLSALTADGIDEQWLPWVPTAVSVGAPPELGLSFANGVKTTEEILLERMLANVVPLASPSVTSSDESSSSSSLDQPFQSLQPREPWRIGVGIDPVVAAVEKTLISKPSRRVYCHTTEESFLLPTRELVLKVQVPREVLDMCIAANRERAKQQAAAGVRTESSLSRDATFGLESLVHEIRVREGDVVFVPCGFSYRFSKPVGYMRTDTMTGQSEVEWSVRVGAKNVECEPVCLRLGYRKYPQLSEEQARVYLPADYATEVDEFYQKGGNPTHRQYK